MQKAENNLEVLLNKLIDLGWKPRNMKWVETESSMKDCFIYGISCGHITLSKNNMNYYYSLNDLCSLDSGLRQFVLEKGLYKPFNRSITDNFNDIDINTYYEDDYQYYLILSSIAINKTQYILDTIKI